jgi:predicted TIM-barrel fold metal-dependent hydrolase
MTRVQGADIVASRSIRRHIPDALWSWIGFACCAAATVMAMNGLAEEPARFHDNPGTDADRFIDAHVHFHDCRKGDLDKVAAWMKANRVQRCINHQLTQSRPKNDAERQQMLANYAQYKGRIDRFCIVYPEEVNSVEEAVTRLAREKQDGAIGFGEHYGVELTFDDPGNLRLYEACAKVGLPVMFHMDRNKNLDEPGLPRLQRVLKTYPNLILIAHSDWWKHLADGTCDRLLQDFPNLYADISCTANRSLIGRDKEFARAFFRRHADKLLFGTDSGWWSPGKSPAPEFTLIDELQLPPEVADKICRRNSERLFWHSRPENAERMKSNEERQR